MKVGVLGAGVMGAGIAQVTATAGYETVCYDVDADALASGQEHVTTGRYGFERGVERGKLTREEADAARARLSFTASFDEAANVDVVIEAVPEKLELKQQVFRDLDAAAPAGTILASNTSGFPIGQIAERHDATRARDRLALGVAARGDASGRDRARPRHQRRHRGDDRRARHRVRQEPGRDHRFARRHVGLRRQPRLHGDDRRRPTRASTRASPRASRSTR